MRGTAEFVLYRNTRWPRKATMGELFLEHVNLAPRNYRIGFTLEDAMIYLPQGQLSSQDVSSTGYTSKKIPGLTAIPSRRYRLLRTYSLRFKTYLPLVLDVPDFTGVRFHGGNTVEDTEGCIILGASTNWINRVWDCRNVLRSFNELLKDYEKQGLETWLEVRGVARSKNIAGAAAISNPTV